MLSCEITGFGIHLKVSDIEKSRKFYESLGFKPVFAYGDEKFRASLPKGLPSAPERYRGITYQIGENAKLEIADGHIAVKDKGCFKEAVKSPKISAMVNVKSLLPLFKNQNVKITFPVRHYYWGTLEAVFRDPDGFVLVFIAPYSKDEFNALNKIVKVEMMTPEIN